MRDLVSRAALAPGRVGQQISPGADGTRLTSFDLLSLPIKQARGIREWISHRMIGLKFVSGHPRECGLFGVARIGIGECIAVRFRVDGANHGDSRGGLGDELIVTAASLQIPSIVTKPAQQSSTRRRFERCAFVLGQRFVRRQ